MRKCPLGQRTARSEITPTLNGRVGEAGPSPEAIARTPRSPSAGARLDWTTNATVRGQRTWERILDIAERIFANQGFETASIRAIASRAKICLPVLYYYFGSKTGLTEAVLQRRFGPL